MKDTPPRIERKFREMLLRRTGEERLKMGCSMHATAQALAKASILQRHPGSHPVELKRLFFLHFFGADFNPEEQTRIASALSGKRRFSEVQVPRFTRSRLTSRRRSKASSPR